MRTVIVLLTFLIAGINLNYSQTLSPSLLSSAGEFFTAPSFSLSMTVGDLVISTAGSGSIILTQGFQQPDLVIETFLSEKMIDWEVRAWPNPVTDKLNISISLPSPMILNLEILDLNGRSILLQQTRGPDTYHQLLLDLQQLVNGFYIMKVYSEDHRVQKIIKLEKY